MDAETARLTERFTQVYRNLKLFPLFEPEEIKAFRKPYGQNTLGKLRREISFAPDSGKLIFTGHRGCGKSTLLAQLAQQMREDLDFFVVGFSIAKMVEMSDVNHVNILYSVALRLMEAADNAKVPIPQETQDALLGWFTTTKSTIYNKQIQEQLSLGANLFDFFRGKLQTEKAFREEIKETYQNSVSDLASQIDRIAAAVQIATKKDVLVIIDDLDKLDLPLIRGIFQDNINSLYLPNIRIIFTIPIAVIRETKLMATIGTRSEVIQLPVTKFFHKADAHIPEAKLIEKNVSMLETILAKRIPTELIEPETLRSLVLMSGGVLREMVRLGQECCRECLLVLDMEPERTTVKIDEEILRKAARNLRIQFERTLGSDLLEVLKHTYENFKPKNANSENFLELLHSLYVLEYENDALWYDLHPLIQDLLQRQGVI
ncbi:MAG: P-loop NTPase fold protein [Cyanobacteria bacterium J06621_11]